MSEVNRIIRGRKLTTYRELRHLTKEEMAHQLGVSPNTDGRYEKGEFEPKVDQWEKIAEILNVPVEELLKTEPIVIHMSHNQMAMPNFGSQNNHAYPEEMVQQLADRVKELERTSVRFIDLIEKLIKERE